MQNAGRAEGEVFSRYFDHVFAINLPSRPDRLRSVRREVSRIGFGPDALRIVTPVAADDPAGFPSTGVRSLFLTHLSILETARREGAGRILLLEDDAIFSRRAMSETGQRRATAEVERHQWGLWFPGHNLRRELAGAPRGVTPTRRAFGWSHCIAVHARALDPLIAYMQAVLARPPGHPAGGPMHVDGAYTMYRQGPDPDICLISNPILANQMGSDSSLAGPAPAARRWLRPPRQAARRVRDEVWRWTDRDFR